MTYSYHILEQLKIFAPRDRLRMHMPGHKGAAFFGRAFPGAARDITELSFSDDLQSPSHIIAAAQRDIAEIVGAKRVFITTDGSSSGVMACVYVASRFGNKLIVPRNSHKSVFNACRILGVEPVIVQGEEREGVLLPPSAELVEKLVVNDVNIAGMIVASPDYYGNIAPLGDYAAVLKANGRYLFCDGAHGAHLALTADRAGYCGLHADMWVDGAHKTLPTLTQGAYVCVNCADLVHFAEEAMSVFRTTSPSYPVMASVEYGVKYYKNNPAALERAREGAEWFRRELSRALTFYPSDDWAKIAVDCKPLGVSPRLVQQKLEKRGIYIEMNDGRYLLFYLSPVTTKGELKRLASALMGAVSARRLRGTYREVPGLPPPAARTYSYLYALKAKTELVPLKGSAGKMIAENVGITPPCLPVLIAGEIITERAVEILSKSSNTFGVYDGMIKVVKR